MDSVLIISGSKKNCVLFSEMLNAVQFGTIVIQNSGSPARRLLYERDFDLVIIDSPLADETGENLSIHIAMKEAEQVILVVDAEHYEAVSSVTEDYGVVVIPKPVDRNFFWSALKLVKSVHKKLRRISEENSRLSKKIEDIRIIDRAKGILISCLKITEEEAHKYIEKKSMDMRIPKRSVAEEILRTYKE